MSPTTQTLAALALELRGDRLAIAGKVASLTGWSEEPAEGEQVYIPAGLLQHVYGGLESFVRRAVRVFDGSLPTGENWHRELMRIASQETKGKRPPILESTGLIDDLRGFRHVLVNAYRLSLDPEKVRALAADAVAGWPRLAAQLDEFVAFVEECEKQAP